MQNEPIHKSIINRLTEAVFYGNYFYGLCVVFMMLETTLLLKEPFQGMPVYITAFIATVLFYNYPYSRNYSSPAGNARTEWYIRNHHFVMRSQVVFTLSLLVLSGWLYVIHAAEIKEMNRLFWFLLLVFPAAGAMYYGANFISRKYNLRQVGWLKPFVIGFVWAGMVTTYPVLYNDLIHSRTYTFTLLGNLLFLKNFMFVSLLAIMFDVKDYASDSNNHLNTLIVKIGLRKTIFYVLLPLTVLGLLTFISYAVTHQFHLPKMILIMIPFFLLLAAIRSLRKRRTLLYYLCVIDGLMLVKALFGIAAAVV